jgi:hypothetical protein
MFRRRSFLAGCAGVASMPAFAQLALPVPGRIPTEPLGVDSAATLSEATEAEGLVLRIDGWHTSDEPGLAADGQAWVYINSSWRAAWR